jgi:hypothetical protein
VTEPQSGDRKRKFDESKVKRDRGRFAKKAGPKLTPGDTVTNANGQTGRVLGKAPDGRLIVQRPNGSRAYWVPAEVRKRHPRKPGYKSAKGSSRGSGSGYKSAKGSSRARGGGGGSGGGRGGGKSKGEAARNKAMRFLAKVTSEQEAAKAENRPARLYVGDKIDEATERLRKAGVPTRTVNGVMVADFPTGPIEMRPGRRLRKDRATREEIDAEKARKKAQREAEKAREKARREAERAREKARRDGEREAGRAADRRASDAEQRREQARDAEAAEERRRAQARRDAEWDRLRSRR